MPSTTGNRLLDALSPASRQSLVSRAVSVPLPLKASLYRAEETPQFAFFMTSGMCSVVTPMQDGATAEVGVIGSEGVVGALHLLGPGMLSTDAFTQLQGTALRIPLPELQKAFHASAEIRARILEFVQEQAVITSQIAGCNRLHEAEERLARWLLMASDRTHSDHLDFTQEFLAMMVGARRTTVTLIAGSLQKAGLIEYQRGQVKIIDRANLEAAACHCYQITRHLLDGLYTSPPAAV